MSDRLSKLNRKFNIFMFLFASAVFILFSALFYGGVERVRLFRDISSVPLFGVAAAINYSMPRKLYLRSSAVTVWATGLLLWMVWCSYEYFTGLYIVRDMGTLYKLAALIAFTFTFFLSARIIIAYDLKIPYLKIVLLITGAIIVTRYVTHFDGFAFTSKLGRLFLAGGRYRNAYGFRHPNHAGFTCAYFMIFSLIYKAAVEEKQQKTRRGGGGQYFMYAYMLLVSVVALLVMVGAASRSAITSIPGFLLVYFLLYVYRKNAVTANALLVVAIAIAVFIALIAVDWYFILVQSNRLGNFTLIFNMSANELMTGYGFVDYGHGLEELGDLGASFLDNAYAALVIRSGVTGLLLFLGSILISMKIFFRDIKHMTKLQRAIGALCIQGLYFLNFEKSLYEFSWFGLTAWSMYVVVAAEKAQAHKGC